MIRLGEKQMLQIDRIKEIGAFLTEPADTADAPVKTVSAAAGQPRMQDSAGEGQPAQPRRQERMQPDIQAQGVLLPKKEVPQGAKPGDLLEVFVYRDSSDRLITTTAEPVLTCGQTAVLKVRQVTKIGAFLDWGLPKDLLLPFKEQTKRVREGELCLVALYIDKSSRLCATMKVYAYLQTDAPYQKEDHVTGYIYQIHPQLGAFVAVDGIYHGLIPGRQLHGEHTIGEQVQVRVTKVREDGKLELSMGERMQVQIDVDAQRVLQIIASYDGVLPFTEKAAPAVIERETGMSKAAFKRAVGRLLKRGQITIAEGVIRQA